MAEHRFDTDVVIAGGGLAGIATALELLDHDLKVLLLDRDVEEHFGGLAKKSYGGMFFVDTPYQRLLGIRDSPELALRDWLAFAEFDAGDEWPRRWAEQYVLHCRDDVYDWLRRRGVRFFPVVHWVERGLYTPGNSVPRFHVVWGTGEGLIAALLRQLQRHPRAANLQVRFRHHVTRLLSDGGRVSGVCGVDEASDREFTVRAGATVIASGGLCGDLERVRRDWFRPWGTPPGTLVNGSHAYADGELHDAAAQVNANITHLDRMWVYAGGVHHPHPRFPEEGLSLVPPRSALWLDYRGERLGPLPAVTGFDTRAIVAQICAQPEKYSWQVLNWRIAVKELGVSGAEFNDEMREKRLIAFLKTSLLGDARLARIFTRECPDFVTADSPEELADKMNALAGAPHVDARRLRATIERYDANFARPARFRNDDQLRRLDQIRRYLSERTRTAPPRPILDPRARPLIAIREFLLPRKTLGGIQTDLAGRVLTPQGSAIPGLYAAGEAAGFGGGGSHGLRALEGTFLGTCILTGRLAARSIAGVQL